MATRYPSDRPSGTGGVRRSGSAPARTGARPAQRPRPDSYHRGGDYRRPASAQGRAPSRSRRGKPSRFPLFVALLAILLIVVLVVIKPFGQRKAPSDVPTIAQTDPQGGGAGDSGSPSGGTGSEPGDSGQGQAGSTPYEDISSVLADEENDAGGLSADQMAQVADLSVNPSLPSEWMNVLLLGTDERVLSDSARTDSMIICSINVKDGRVKLTSIMRDLAIEFNDIGEYSGTYRINAANFFGGYRLAIKTVNEKFNLNIQHYAMVNFFGFQRIAERLGGIDIDITEEEMNKINAGAYSSWKIAKSAGIDVSDVTYEELTTFGPNTHLNGTQTLAYARIRKLSGGDAMRTERQRKVLSKLLEKAKLLSPMEMATIANDMLQNVRTDMEFNDIFKVATLVMGNGISNIESMHLPISGTYKEETRNNQSMLYDCDFEANARQLHSFIYD